MYSKYQCPVLKSGKECTPSFCNRVKPYELNRPQSCGSAYNPGVICMTGGTHNNMQMPIDGRKKQHVFTESTTINADMSDETGTQIMTPDNGQSMRDKVIEQNNIICVDRNASLLEIVKNICEDTPDHDHVPEKFIKYIITFLLSLTDILPQQKSKIHRVISVLVNFGMQYDQLINAIKPGPGAIPIENSCSFQALYEHTVIHNEMPISLSKLYEIDKKIRDLQDEKFKVYDLYPYLTGPEQGIVISDNENERCNVPCNGPCNGPCNVPLLPCQNSTPIPGPYFEPTQTNPETNDGDMAGFSPEVLSLAITKTERMIKMQVEDPGEMEAEQSGSMETHSIVTDDQSANEDYVTSTENIIVNDTINNEHEMNTQSSALVPLPSADDQDVNDDSETEATNNQDTCPIINSHEVTSVVFESQQHDIVIIRGLKKLCFAGCKDGSICVFRWKSGKLYDVIKKHTDVVTSITTWNIKIISTSLDGCINLYNPTSKVFRSLVIGEPIKCSDEHAGILYLGTTYGSIFTVNVRSLTQIRSQIQVSPSVIVDLKAFQDVKAPSLIVVAEGRPVTIRNAENGSLIRTLKHHEDCEIIGLISSDRFICCTANKENISFTSINNDEEVMFYKESIVAKNMYFTKEHVFVGGNDGRIRVYNNQAILIYIINGPGKAINYFTLHHRRMLICCENKLVMSVRLPDDLLGFINYSSFEDL